MTQPTYGTGGPTYGTGRGVAVRPTGGLSEQLTYAKALASADLLPKAYQGKPANLLLALAYGDALHLSISQVLNGINVIEGKPSMGAELMQALIRQAGHRIRVSGNEQAATCSIWRADDPEFEYRTEWTVARAVQAGLCALKDGKPFARSYKGSPLPWESYTGAMLRARAVSECARMAVADVLAGVSYTAEELETPQWVNVDPDPEPPPAAPAAPPARQRKLRKAEAPAADPEVVEADTAPPASPDAPPVELALAEQAERDAEALEWRAQWLEQLDAAMNARDLDAIESLGNDAGRAGADDLVEQARDAWSIVAQQ